MRRRDSGGSWSRWAGITGSGAATTSHTVTQLTNGTGYGFQVRAVNIEGPALASNEATATPAATAVRPAAVGDLSATAGQGRVTLSWRTPGNGGAAIIGYQLRRRAGSDAWSAWAGISGSGAATTAHTVRGLKSATTYRFQVRAVNARGHGGDSNTAVATTPAARLRLRAHRGNAQATLVWETPDDGGTAITSWQYRRDGGAWRDIDRSVATTRAYTVVGLRNNTAYSFEVRAVNTTGPGQPSDPAQVTPWAFVVSTAPGTIYDITAVGGDGEVTLRWTTPHNGGSLITGYRIRHRQRGHYYGQWTDIADSDQMTITHTISGLTNNTDYIFDLRAVNVAGASDSNETPATPTPATAPPTTPAAIDDLTATPGDQQVDLDWTTPHNGGADITHYQTRWRVAGDHWGEWTDTRTRRGDLTAISIINTKNGTTYSFQVRAVNTEGPAAASNEATTTPHTATNNPATGRPTITGTAQTEETLTADTSTITDSDGLNNAVFRYQWLTDDTAIPNATSPTYTPTSHDTGKTIKVQTSFTDDHGNTETLTSHPTTPVTAPEPQPTPGPPPAAPANLTAHTTRADPRNGGSPHIIELRWNNPNNPDITNYQYRIKSETDNQWSRWWDANTTTTSIKIGFLNQSTRYQTQLRAINNNTPGPPSETTFTTPPTH